MRFAAFVAFGAAMMGAASGLVVSLIDTYSQPPATGIGPYPPEEHYRLIWTGVVAAVLGLALCGLVARREWRKHNIDSSLYWPLLGLAQAFSVCILVSVASTFGHYEIRIDSSGFGLQTAHYSGGPHVLLRNTSAVPVTVCVGAAGHCDAPAFAPPVLRSSGATIPPGGYVSVTLPNTTGELPLTITRPGGLPRQDLMVTLTFDSFVETN